MNMSITTTKAVIKPENIKKASEYYQLKLNALK